eukprot:5067823-Pyramimonas_sp.AAC.1
MCLWIPAVCVEYVAALEPPDFYHGSSKNVQAYGALVEVAVTDDGRCCRWPGTRLTLQGALTSLVPNR